MKHPRALTIIAGVFAGLLAPPDTILPSAWAAKNLIVPDGPYAGMKWNPELTPYVIEPLDLLAPDTGVNKVVIRKSAQTGFTTLALAFIGHSIDTDPCRMMVVQPTDAALNEFNREKLGEAINQTAALKKKVRSQTSRSALGSTSYSKRFPGGSLTLAIATSTADLRSKTVKKVVKDEASDYPADLDGQGSPHAMIEARYESFLRSGEWKELNISTPVVKGECYIDAEFEAGDQRYWHVKCPGCGEKFTFVFDRRYFKYEESFPHQAHYVAPCCGTIIPAEDKYELVQTSPFKWIATNPGAGRHASYHFDALSSPMVPWDVIAARVVKAGDDPSRLKGFYNLTLGLAYEMKGDAPDHERLMERRAEMKRGIIPPLGLILVVSADVQMRGIYVEVLAIAPDQQSWVVDALFLDGDTSDPTGGAFLKLTEIYERSYPDAFGGRRKADAFGVDSGYRSHVVYTWVRARPGAFALKGMDGWSRPALGTPSLVDVDFGGKKVKNGATIWGVGTWSLKAGFYSHLRKTGMTAGAEIDPPGYCHFGTWLDEIYFRQITSEYLGEERFRGRSRKIWKIRGGEENHFLDCRIYNMALADYLGLSRMTADDWAELAKERGLPDKMRDPTLFAPAPKKLAEAQAQKPLRDDQSENAEPPDAKSKGGWLDGYRVKI